MKFLLVFIALLILASCSEKTETQCPCLVKIPQMQKDGSYKLEVVELKTLENAKRISSSKIKITINPHFYEDGTLSESVPRAQYIVSDDNIIIPQGSEAAQTGEMFSLYKIMEDLYFFDKAIGTDKVLSYPRVVSLQTRPNGGRNLNDAHYMQDYDRIVFFKYMGSKVPLSLNPGIIAHEHFHAIFNKIIKPTISTVSGIDKILQGKSNVEVSENQGYNFLILKALDEGIADFWAHMHTGLVNPYLPSYSEQENMEGRVILPVVAQMDSQETLSAVLNFETFKVETMEESVAATTEGQIYGKSVMFSNLFKSISEKITVDHDSNDTRAKNVEIGKWIVESLKRLSGVVAEKGKKTILTQADILESFNPVEEDSNVRSKICADLNKFLTHHPKVPSCSGL